MTDRTQTKEGTLDPKFYPKDGLTSEEPYNSKEQDHKLLMGMVTAFDRLETIEHKMTLAENALYDAELVLAGVCIGLFLAIILVH